MQQEIKFLHTIFTNCCILLVFSLHILLTMHGHRNLKIASHVSCFFVSVLVWLPSVACGSDVAKKTSCLQFALPLSQNIVPVVLVLPHQILAHPFHSAISVSQQCCCTVIQFHSPLDNCLLFICFEFKTFVSHSTISFSLFISTDCNIRTSLCPLLQPCLWNFCFILMDPSKLSQHSSIITPTTTHI